VSNFDRDLALALDAVRAAAIVVMRSFGTKMDVVLKSPDQPLTQADLDSDKLIEDMLMYGRPDYGWLSEETADRPERRERELVWIVDPIDGTRSFIAGRPEFAISIGLARAGAAVMGVVCNPATNELFWAVAGEGAWGARAGEAARRLSIRSAADDTGLPVLLASRSEIARGEFERFQSAWKIEPRGSTAYKLASVASGVGDAFFSRGPKSEWDVCAGALIVEEAGGVATQLDGSPYRYNKPDPHVRGVVAGTRDAHERIVQEIGQLPPVHSDGGREHGSTSA
jgi:myo-inositol-1(or 4)-monophosphatase